MSELCPPTARPDTRIRTVAAAVTLVSLGAASLLVGCARQPRSAAEYSDCAATDLGQWDAVPQDVNVPKVADRLGQKIDKVVNGMMGLAYCERGIDASDVNEGEAVRVVGVPSGISNRCLAIMSDVPPSPGAVAHSVGVLCPAA